MSRRKKLKIIVPAVFFSLLMLMGAVALIVHTRSFNQFVLAQVISRIEQSTGTRIEVQSLKLTWSPFTAELFGLVAHGRERANEPPLFEADHLAVSLGLRPLLSRQVNLYRITLDRPVVNARIDTTGTSNLPVLKASSSSNFSFIVRHASLRQGIVRFNDEEIPLAAEIDDLNALVTYDATSGMYHGDVSYRTGQLTAPGWSDTPHSASLQFVANRQVLELKRLEVKSLRSEIELAARLSNPSEPQLDGEYRGYIQTDDLAGALRSASLPRGAVTLSGTVHYKLIQGLSAVRGLQIEGQLHAPKLAVRTEPALVFVRNLRAAYQLKDGNLAVSQLDANVFDGRLSGKALLSGLDTTRSGRFTGNLKNVSLQTVSDALFANNARNRARLLGQLNLNAEAQWGKDISALKGRLHAAISGPNSVPREQAGALPVNGVVNASYDAAAERASFDNSRLHVAQTTLTLNGEISRTSQLNVDLAAPDLRELNGLIYEFSASQRSLQEPGSPARERPYELGGAAHFSGQVTGNVQDPRLKGRLSATNLQVQGSSWRTLEVSLSADPSAIVLQQGNLEGTRQGQITFDARVGLNHWSYMPGNPIALNAKLTKIPVADLQRLAKEQYPITGDLSGSAAISGSQSEPQGQASLQLSKASAWNEPIRLLKLDFQGDTNSAQMTAALELDAGVAKVHLGYSPKMQHYELRLNTPGLRLEQLQAVQRSGGSITGLLTASVTGDGTVKDPRLSAILEIPDLKIAGQNFTASKAQIEVAQQRADIKLDSALQQGFVHANGTVEMKNQYQTNTTIDLRALPIGALLASHSLRTGMAQDLEGYTEIHATVTGPLKEPARLVGRVEIPRLNFAYKGMEIANDAPLRVRYQNGIATIEQARMRGTGTDLRVQGVVPIEAGVPLNASAEGEFDAKLLQLITPDIHSHGKVEFDLRASGGLRAPETNGTIRIVDTGLAMEGAPLAISNLNGRLSIAGNRLQIDKLEATSGGGTLSANGSARYGKEANFAFDLHAKGVRAAANGIRSTLNANLQLNGTPQKSDLKGQVVVERLSFQEGFDLSSFVSQLSGDSTVSSPSPFASNMQLGVAVQSAESLSLASSQVSIAGAANLTVAGTAAKPVILGRINLTNGELFFQNKRFEIQNGSIVFSNPALTEPLINLYVKTVVEQYNITINFAGPLDRLKTNYTSDPSLPPLDIINLLAFGQTTAERNSNASTPASLGAESVIAQGVAGQVAKGVQNLTGISQLTIDPTMGASRDPGAQVAIQQRVSGTILMTFSTDVTSTQRQTVQLQYQPKPQWKISVLRDQYGGYGVDVRLHKVF